MVFLPSLVDSTARCDLNSFAALFAPARRPQSEGPDLNPEPSDCIDLRRRKRKSGEGAKELLGGAGGRRVTLRMIRYDRSYVLRYNNKSGRGKKDWGPAGPLTQCMDRGGEVCCAVFGPGQGLSHCTTPAALHQRRSLTRGSGEALHLL